MRQPGIADVARAARVSSATVSRVVNGNYSVAATTKARVLRAIARLGYQPNAVARSLKVTRTKIIGFLVSDISNLHFTAMARAIEDRISAAGYNLIVCSTDGLRERELAYLRTLMGRRVDALIINKTGLNDPHIGDISRAIPIVLVDRRIRRTVSFRGDFVGSDNRRAAALLTGHLLELGHRRIGMINGPVTLSTGRERYAGFVQAMAGRGVDAGRGYPLRYDGDFNEGSGSKGAEALLSLHPGPTALIVMNNAMLLGALKRLRSPGNARSRRSVGGQLWQHPRRRAPLHAAQLCHHGSPPARRRGERDGPLEARRPRDRQPRDRRREQAGRGKRRAPPQGRRSTSTSRAPVAGLRLTTARTP